MSGNLGSESARHLANIPACSLDMFTLILKCFLYLKASVSFPRKRWNHRRPVNPTHSTLRPRRCSPQEDGPRQLVSGTQSGPGDAECALCLPSSGSRISVFPGSLSRMNSRSCEVYPYAGSVGAMLVVSENRPFSSSPWAPPFHGMRSEEDVRWVEDVSGGMMYTLASVLLMDGRVSWGGRPHLASYLLGWGSDIRTYLQGIL